MYRPNELARFALAEFRRGLEDLTDEEARTRMRKADGSEMNAISWTAGHIAGHWLNRPEQLQQFAPGSGDPTPPPLDEMQAALDEAKTATEIWLPTADDSLLSSEPDNLRGESVGTGVMRAVLHTWFHIGEINAVRQLLGHDEIGFVGDITEHLEWRGGGGVDKGYRPDELARFAISEFARGLEGLTAEEAQSRIAKAGGGEMNAISWIVGHVNTHWLFGYVLMTKKPMPALDRLYFGAGADPTPPPLADVRETLAEATALTQAWLANVDDALLSSKRDFGPLPDENLGTQLMRAVLHTWFHTGEINAVRQMLGHAEIPFVGEMLGSLEWRSASA